MSGAPAAEGAARGRTFAWSAEETIERLAGRGGSTAIVEFAGDEMRETSAAELARRAEAMAGALYREGIAAGEAVAIHAANGADWIAAGLACGRIGAVIAPLDAALPRPEAARIAKEMGVRLLLWDADPEHGPTPIRDLRRLGETGDAPPPAPAIAAKAPAAMFRTSGTTGPPKTFALNAGALGFNVRGVAGSGLVREGDRVLMPLPLHHVFPWIVGTLVSLDVGAALVLPEGVSGPQIAAALRVGRPTVAVGVPRLWEALLEVIRGRLGGPGRALLDALSRLPPDAAQAAGRVIFAPIRRAAAPDLRLLVSGGARLEPKAAAALGALGWDVRTGYGLSETAAIFTGNLYQKRAGSEGRPLPGCEARIAGPGPDGVGEILLRGPNVFEGYLDNPAENARAFDADGFFRTGDLGRLDSDGFLFVTGRVKEVIVLSGGDNIHPEDVERAYAAAPDVAEIAVLERDGALHGLVVPDFAAIGCRGTLNPLQSVKVAMDLVSRDLPATWRLSGLRVTARPLPRTRLGKLRRFMLPDAYEAAGAEGEGAEVAPPSPEERAWIAETPRAEIWSALEAALEDHPFGLDSHLALDLGLDSFAWLNLAVEIETRTGVRLQTGEIAALSTVRDLLTLVSEKPAADPAERDARAKARLEDARRRWLSPRSTVERIAGATAMCGVGALVRSVYRFETGGDDALPKEGPVLICPNHVSDLDPAAVAAALPKPIRDRSVWVADKVRVFEHPVWRRLCRPLRIFPADETAPRIAVELAVETLAAGGAQVWFPEGWRSADGRLLPFQVGVAHVVAASRAPVVPVFLDGTREIWPRDRGRPRLGGRIRVSFGPPLRPEALFPEGFDAPDAPRAAAERLRLAVGALARDDGLDVL